MFLGIYHHPVPDGPMQDYVHSTEVSKSWTNEAIAFASSYAAKSALWLLKLPK